jgi:hypothetical protein
MPIELAVIVQADRTPIFLIYLQLIANQNTDGCDNSSFECGKEDYSLR